MEPAGEALYPRPRIRSHRNGCPGDTGLGSQWKQQKWAELMPPGALAYVLRLVGNITSENTAIGDRAANLGVTHIALKIYATARGQRQGRDIVEFQQRRVVAGRPYQNRGYIQKVLSAGAWPDAQDVQRYWLLQEFIEGETLEEMLTHVEASGEVLDRVTARQLLEDLFAILTEVWINPEEGTEGFFWDLRAANWVVTPQNRLVMIDSDGLKAGKEEKRAGQMKISLQRLRKRTFDIVSAYDPTMRGKVMQALWQRFDMDALPLQTDLGTVRHCIECYLNSVLP